MTFGRALRRRAGELATLCLLLACSRDAGGPLRYPPVVVTALLRLPPAVVQGAARTWFVANDGPVRYGEPLPVRISMYCLSGTTRRGRYVRAGIVAADPKYFPLARYIELYVGATYLGRFLVDDTGDRIRGARIDVWTPACREARRFGLRRGTAVLVPRSAGGILLAGGPMVDGAHEQPGQGRAEPDGAHRPHSGRTARARRHR